MKLRSHKFSTTLTYAVMLAVFMLIIFGLTNAGIDPRAGRSFKDFDPEQAANVCFGLFGLYHSIAIIFFDEDDSPKTAGAAKDAHIPSGHASYTGFMRQPWYKVLSVGPVFAAFSAASVFIWHTFAESVGTPGTVWGDYTTSALPALSLFLICWSTANIGFTFAAIAEAFNRDRPGIFIAALVLMFIVGIGLCACFMFLPDQPTGRGLAIAAFAFPLSLLASVSTYIVAVIRVARFDAANPRLSARARRRADKFGSPKQNRPARRTGAPPLDMLAPGERLLMHIKGDQGREPQLLIATDRRFARASIIAGNRTFVLEQASPGQLTGASSERMGPEVVTIAHFRDRQDMRLVGSQEQESQQFASALRFLAQHGTLPSR